MDSQLNSQSMITSTSADPLEAAHTLGELLYQTPQYQVFLEALKAVNSDPTVQKLAAEMYTHQNALQWGHDHNGGHAAALAQLESEIEALPIVKDYRQAEKEIRSLFRAVDEIISQEAGVDFAIHAQRSGCSCGQ
jgi:cell fate (sporulation/competence/biofilm development) regulator YlbF (YheA/YmcA/DUF963 family)